MQHLIGNTIHVEPTGKSICSAALLLIVDIGFDFVVSCSIR